MIPFTIAILLLSVIHQSMNKPSRCDAGVCPPDVRTDDRSWRDLASDEWLKGPGLDVIHNLGPDSPIAAEDSKNWLLLCTSPSFCSRLSDGLPFVLPLASQIGLIYFHRSREDIWNILCKSSPD